MNDGIDIEDSDDLMAPPPRGTSSSSSFPKPDFLQMQAPLKVQSKSQVFYKRKLVVTNVPQFMSAAQISTFFAKKYMCEEPLVHMPLLGSPPPA